jgi:hypothetical protein
VGAGGERRLRRSARARREHADPPQTGAIALGCLPSTA